MSSTPTFRFARHYVEMLVVMFIGMGALALPVDGLLLTAGTSAGDVWDDAPAIMLSFMCLSMTGPMVAWMRFRGHAWAASLEMGASMVLPTLFVLTLLWTGALTGNGALMTLEHALMLPAMLVAMLLRRDEYTMDHRAHHPAGQAA
jgi:hypothetical protein